MTWILGVKWFPNPKLALIIAAAENTALFAYLVVNDASVKNLFIFAFNNAWTKLLPIYLLRNTKIRESDIVWVFLLFIVYFVVGYIHYGGIGFVDVQKDIINGYLSKNGENVPKTYFHNLVEKMVFG